MPKSRKINKVGVQGWDLSLRHGGFVELADGELQQFWYVTDIVGSAKKSERGTLLKDPKVKDNQQWNVQRLIWWKRYLGLLVSFRRPHFLGIEDYALGAAQGAHYIGELGGIAKIVSKEAGVKLRLHDPLSIKMFATHNGHADKAWMEAAVKERWGVDFSEFNPQKAKKTKKNPKGIPTRQTSEDLADAFAIAKLVWTEVRLRRGDLVMSELHEKEVQVFNRVTKMYPLSLLSREWI